MPDSETSELVGRAHELAKQLLESSGREVDGVVLIAELDGQGVLIVFDDECAPRLSTILAEASWRTAGAGQ